MSKIKIHFKQVQADRIRLALMHSEMIRSISPLKIIYLIHNLRKMTLLTILSVHNPLKMILSIHLIHLALPLLKIMICLPHSHLKANLRIFLEALKDKFKGRSLTYLDRSQVVSRNQKIRLSKNKRNRCLGKEWKRLNRI